MLVKSNSLILLVEDCEEDVLFFKNALKRSGLGNPFQIVRDGVDALSYLTGQFQFTDRNAFPSPGILLLDLTLPKLSGWDVLQWVRSRSRFDNLVVIVLTASLRVEDLTRAYQLGADSFLNKPCDPHDLRNLAKAFPERWHNLPDSGELDSEELSEAGLHPFGS